MKILFIALLVSTLYTQTSGQADSVALELAGAYIFDNPIIPYSAYTSDFDKLGRPYFFSACQELGLLTFKFDALGTIIAVDTLSPSIFAGLRPTNVSQVDALVYVALGSFAGLFPQRAGMAVLDAADPESLTLLGQWDSSAFNQGCADILIHNNKAYLAAMEKGIISLDVSDPVHPVFLDNIIPDPLFPDIPGLFTTPNARGLGLYHSDTLLLCYDHGGLRKIDISDPANMMETGMYMNWDLYDIAAPAYNNVVVKNTTAFATVDYCGIDVIDLEGDTMTNVFWFNPWDCAPDNWDGRPGHTNGITYYAENDLLFVSGGDSEVLVFDISETTHPVWNGAYAFPGDSIVAWSLDVHDGFVSLALVDNSVVGVPYYSDKGGVELLRWEAFYTNQIEQTPNRQITIFPNPVQENIFLRSTMDLTNILYSIKNMQGEIVQSGTLPSYNIIALQQLPANMYILQLYDSDATMFAEMFIKL